MSWRGRAFGLWLMGVEVRALESQMLLGGTAFGLGTWEEL